MAEVVGSSNQEAGGGVLTVQITRVVAEGNTLIACVRATDIAGIPVLSGVADNQNGSYGAAIEDGGYVPTDERGVAAFRKTDCAAGSTTVTATFATAVDICELVVIEVSGLAIVDDVDQTNNANSNDATVHPCGTITTTSGVGGIIVGMGALGSGPTVTPAAGYTQVTSGDRFVVQYKISVGNETTDAAYTTGAAANSTNCIISLKNSGAPTPPPVVTDVNTNEEVVAESVGNVATGTNFDVSSLEIEQADGPITQTLTASDATTATFTNVFDAGAGPHLKYGSATFRVINVDLQDGTLPITLVPGIATDFVDLVDPLADPGDRLTSIPDLSAGDQIEWGDVVGGNIDDVIVFSDGSFSVEVSVTSFDFRVWDASDATWGPWATVTIDHGGGPGPSAQISQITITIRIGI